MGNKHSNDGTDWEALERAQERRSKELRALLALKRWGRVRDNPKAIRADILEAERHLLERVREL